MAISPPKFYLITCSFGRRRMPSTGRCLTGSSRRTMLATSIGMTRTTIPDHGDNVVVFATAILAGVFVFGRTFVRLMRSPPVRMVHATIPCQVRQVVILAAAILAEIDIALRAHKQLMLPLALWVSRTAIGQQ